MTREQALETLKEMAFTAYGHRSEALDMAISALSENKGDLISRQAVLDGIEELKKSPWATDTRGTGFEYLIAESLDTVRDLVVKPIPTAENKGEWIPDHTVFTKCSCCGWYMRTECFKPYRPKSYHFCPNCGADMRGE